MSRTLRMLITSGLFSVVVFGATSTSPEQLDPTNTKTPLTRSAENGSEAALEVGQEQDHSVKRHRSAHLHSKGDLHEAATHADGATTSHGDQGMARRFAQKPRYSKEDLLQLLMATVKQRSHGRRFVTVSATGEVRQDNVLDDIDSAALLVHDDEPSETATASATDSDAQPAVPGVVAPLAAVAPAAPVAAVPPGTPVAAVPPAAPAAPVYPASPVVAAPPVAAAAPGSIPIASATPLGYVPVQNISVAPAPIEQKDQASSGTSLLLLVLLTVVVAIVIMALVTLWRMQAKRDQLNKPQPRQVRGDRRESRPASGNGPGSNTGQLDDEDRSDGASKNAGTQSRTAARYSERRSVGTASRSLRGISSRGVAGFAATAEGAKDPERTGTGPTKQAPTKGEPAFRSMRLNNNKPKPAAEEAEKGEKKASDAPEKTTGDDGAGPGIYKKRMASRGNTRSQNLRDQLLLPEESTATEEETNLHAF